MTVGFFVVLGLFIFNKNSLELTSMPVIPAGIELAGLTNAQFAAVPPVRSDFVLQIINICVGTLTAAFATVMSFWLGSSQSSQSKDQLVAQIQTRQSVQASEVLNRATDVVVRRSSTLDLPPPSKPALPEKEPDSEPAGDPVKPAAPGLLGELIPELVKPHRHFPDGVSWALSPRGVSIDEAPAQGTPGKPTTVRTIWQRYGALCAAAAKQYGVPVELIVATIATESSGDANARRSEPKINDESVGLMQTLVATARSATGRKNLRSDDLLDPRSSIEAGTAYIAQQRGSTWFDPPLVAAAYNAGSLRRDDADANRWKLVCFPRGTGKHIDKFVAWFSDCMVVAAEDGWATDPTVPSFASALGVQGAGRAGSSPHLDLAPLVSTEERQRLFGTFTFVADPKPGNRENIRITNDWPEKNIIKVSIPVKSVLGRNGPLEFEFHKLAADQLVAMWLEWEKEGLLDRILTFDGAFVPRFIRGSTSTLSNHAFGTAFDINAQFNPLGHTPADIGEKGCVRELVPIANRFGFAWGGHFKKRPDGMHFEVARIIQPGVIV
ncbi:transglycosylase SLT domain-containing protein [Mesorhizobium sp. WSM2239]|uniref:Transglycosylase SLT domain-containing protein n=2 Tax=unclassified Mesorhizobium TaxID=325217 RepID=A0AAU8D3X6_9HYPH